ncbi:DUF7385 family protein [Halopenitus persicus]|uniref:Flagella cluster protein n=1 Tax=Halopenitus persicus TaxID=1048396 RepID=A0A1H3KP37_9EURY|nr:hypothetical protein [Halopenitus persicus]QHS17879.1 flagella cluster protein [haloarchaeon 3A1-DGR]SDY53829.1 hypothetical protein SAMN05216564_10695 [Halopenitus persicus]
MPTVDFDVHANRHRLKQLRNAGDTELYENRDDVACPACGEPFTRLFVTERATTTFPETDGSRFCLGNGPDGIYVFRH